ncbi:MAG TPA: Ig-like domain-containing protein, partial [Solirubrobacteraceae bacterium]
HHGTGLALARYVGARQTDAAPPSVGITPPATTTGAVTYRFSEEVRDVTATNAVLRRASTNGNLAGTLRCFSASGATVGCLAGPVRRATLTPTGLVPGGRYTAIADPAGVAKPIRDAAGNALPATALAFRGDRSIEDDDPAVAQAWAVLEGISGAHAGTVHRERTAGASAWFSFTGTGADLIMGRGPRQGRAGIYVDGAFEKEIDGYAAQWSRRRVPIGPLAPGAHIVRVEATGTRGPQALDAWVSIDAFQVAGQDEPSDPADTRWAPVQPTGASGGRALTSTAQDARLSLRFQGTSVDVRMRTGPDQGQATLAVDGGVGLQVDNAAATPGWVTRSVTGLDADAVHSLSVIAAGAGGVTVDRFDVG